ncbi:MAG TPA: ABC transporter substrate-binding protein, partial [Reyranella sp.]
RMPTLASARKIDDMTVELTTKEPDSFLPINLTNLFMASPTKWQAFYDKAEGADAKAKSQAAWAAFAKEASGTGPWKMSKFTPRERLELVKNEGYWDKARVPKTDRMVLLPMPEANARTAALLSGQVDWVEAPAPDAVKEIKQRGFTITSNEEPHVWPWQFSRLPDSPWNDIRVRKAANLCIDREGLRDGLLGGYMVPATGTFEVGHPWRGKPSFQIKYDKPAALKLMAEAGYGPSKHLAVKIQTSASGSGQMQPLPMNEYIQQNLAEVGIKVDFDVVEWNAMINMWRAGAKSDLVKGANGINFTYFIQDPFTAFIRHLDSKLVAPGGTNWGYYADPAMDALFDKARTTFDAKAQDDVLRQIHQKIVDEALFLFVTHDVNPRAMSAKVTGFVQAQNWFQDFSPITMK